MSDIMLEVDDEIRSQQLKAMWARYGQWIIGLFVATVLATAIGVLWFNYINDKLEKDTDRLLNVLQQEDPSSKETMAALSELQKKATAPLRTIVAMQNAQRLEQAGDIKATSDTYQSIIDDRKAPKVYRQLATVHRVRLGLIEKEDASKLIGMIDPLTAEGANFRPSAMELKGVLLQQQGKKAEANAVFQALSTDVTAPNTLRLRAQTMTNYETGNAQ
jgi:hypothetical protein